MGVTAIELDFWGRPATPETVDAGGATTVTVDMPGTAGRALVARIRSGKAGDGMMRPAGDTVTYASLAAGYDAAAAGALVNGDAESAERYTAAAKRVREIPTILSTIGSMRAAASKPAERSTVLTRADLVDTYRALGNRWAVALTLIGNDLEMDMTGQPTLFDAPEDPNPGYVRNGRRPSRKIALSARFDAPAVKRLSAKLPPVYLVDYSAGTGVPAVDPADLVDLVDTVAAANGRPYRRPIGVCELTSSPAVVPAVPAPAPAGDQVAPHPFVKGLGNGRRCAVDGCDRGQTARVHRVAPAPAESAAVPAPAGDQVDTVPVPREPNRMGTPFVRSAPAGDQVDAPAPVVDQVDTVTTDVHMPAVDDVPAVSVRLTLPRDLVAPAPAVDQVDTDAPATVPARIREIIAAGKWTVTNVGTRRAPHYAPVMTLTSGRLDYAEFCAVRDTLAGIARSSYSKKFRGFVFEPGTDGNPWRAGTPSGTELVKAWLDATVPAAGDQVGTVPAVAPAPAGDQVDAPAACVASEGDTVRFIGRRQLWTVSAVITPGVRYEIETTSGDARRGGAHYRSREVDATRLEFVRKGNASDEFVDSMLADLDARTGGRTRPDYVAPAPAESAAVPAGETATVPATVDHAPRGMAAPESSGIYPYAAVWERRAGGPLVVRMSAVGDRTPVRRDDVTVIGTVAYEPGMVRVRMSDGSVERARVADVKPADLVAPAPAGDIPAFPMPADFAPYAGEIRGCRDVLCVAVRDAVTAGTPVNVPARTLLAALVAGTHTRAVDQDAPAESAAVPAPAVCTWIAECTSPAVGERAGLVTPSRIMRLSVCEQHNGPDATMPAPAGDQVDTVPAVAPAAGADVVAQRMAAIRLASKGLKAGSYVIDRTGGVTTITAVKRMHGVDGFNVAVPFRLPIWSAATGLDAAVIGANVCRTPARSGCGCGMAHTDRATLAKLPAFMPIETAAVPAPAVDQVDTVPAVAPAPAARRDLVDARALDLVAPIAPEYMPARILPAGVLATITAEPRPADFDAYRDEIRDCDCTVCVEISYNSHHWSDKRKAREAARVLLAHLVAGTHERVTLAERAAHARRHHDAKVAAAKAAGITGTELFKIEHPDVAMRMQARDDVRDSFINGSGLGMTPGGIIGTPRWQAHQDKIRAAAGLAPAGVNTTAPAAVPAVTAPAPVDQVDTVPAGDTAGSVDQGPTVHVFDSAGEAYDRTQTDDSIRDGDLLHIPSENLVGFLYKAWPVNVTASAGTDDGDEYGRRGTDGAVFHAGADLVGIAGEGYAESIRAARALAESHGYTLAGDQVDTVPAVVPAPAACPVAELTGDQVDAPAVAPAVVPVRVAYDAPAVDQVAPATLAGDTAESVDQGETYGAHAQRVHVSGIGEGDGYRFHLVAGANGRALAKEVKPVLARMIKETGARFYVTAPRKSGTVNVVPHPGNTVKDWRPVLALFHEMMGAHIVPAGECGACDRSAALVDA